MLFCTFRNTFFGFWFLIHSFVITSFNCFSEIVYLAHYSYSYRSIYVLFVVVFVFCIGQWRHLHEVHTIIDLPLHNPTILIRAWQKWQSVIMSWSWYLSPMFLATVIYNTWTHGVIYNTWTHGVSCVFLQLSLECTPLWATSSTMMLWVARGRSPTRRESTVCITQITLEPWWTLT